MESRTAYDTVILAGDIGGTNANFALIGKKGATFEKLHDRRYGTKEEPSLPACLRRFLESAREAAPSFPPDLCCVSGAGPVKAGRIELTNAAWSIDSSAIEREFSIPARVINDFTAVSYGVLLLDPADRTQLLPIARSDGSFPAPSPDGVRLVIGAGTGLGLGFVVRVGERTQAFPSEGGHVTLPAWDRDTREFSAWLEKRFGFVPGAEAGVSGMGIANLHEFLSTRAGRAASSAILAAPAAERPALVSKAAHEGSDPDAVRAMELFVELYARVAADHAATFLPGGGVYLAGGIAAKNERFFLEGDRFRAAFEGSYREHIRAILAETPVWIARDYDVSLYGAANAAVVLS